MLNILQVICIGDLKLTHLGSLEDLPAPVPASTHWSLRSILQCPNAMSLFPPQMLLLPFPDAALGTAAMLIPLHRFCPYVPPRLYCPASLSLLPPLMRVPVLVRLDHLNATLVRPVRRLKQQGSGPVRQPNRPLRKGLPPTVRRPPGLDAAAFAGQPPQAPDPSRAPVADASVNLVLGPPPDAEGPRPPWFGRRSPESAGRSTTGCRYAAPPPIPGEKYIAIK